MKILILEDEQRTADLIIKLIKQYDNSYSVLGVIDSVENGVEWFIHKDVTPDLILADIQLTDGTSFDLFNQVNLDLPVIFITAYNEFALYAFKLNSIDYLLKPLNFADLKKAFDKLIKTRESYVKTYKDYGKILLPGHKAYKQRFLVRSGNSFKNIITDEIAFFISEDGIVFANLLSGGKSIVESSLSELTEMLDPGKFFQVNRNIIVGISAINKISNYFNRRVIVQLKPENREIVVSRERVQNFKEWLNK
jgi:two-component system, LytTR family, response regulator LytT